MRCATALVVAMGLAGGFAGPAGAQPKGGRFGASGFGYGWLGSLEDGKAEARRTGKPLMVAIRCVP